jgi:hypothetical protein
VAAAQPDKQASVSSTGRAAIATGRRTRMEYEDDGLVLGRGSLHAVCCSAVGLHIGGPTGRRWWCSRERAGVGVVDVDVGC